MFVRGFSRTTCDHKDTQASTDDEERRQRWYEFDCEQVRRRSQLLGRGRDKCGGDSQNHAAPMTSRAERVLRARPQAGCTPIRTIGFPSDTGGDGLESRVLVTGVSKCG
jgi:hypothetical protein